jgi:hypothetical protein
LNNRWIIDIHNVSSHLFFGGGGGGDGWNKLSVSLFIYTYIYLFISCELTYI